MKAADRSGAAYAVIVGESERDTGTATVRPLRAGGEQVACRVRARRFVAITHPLTSMTKRTIALGANCP